MGEAAAEGTLRATERDGARPFVPQDPTGSYISLHGPEGLVLPRPFESKAQNVPDPSAATNEAGTGVRSLRHRILHPSPGSRCHRLGLFVVIRNGPPR